jgi:hypothetical protein
MLVARLYHERYAGFAAKYSSLAGDSASHAAATSRHRLSLKFIVTALDRLSPIPGRAPASRIRQRGTGLFSKMYRARQGMPVPKSGN